MKEKIKVEGMACSCCGGKIEKSINQLDGISSIELDVNNGIVQVEFHKDAAILEQIKEKIEAEGYKIV